MFKRKKMQIQGDTLKINDPYTSHHWQTLQQNGHNYLIKV